MVRHTLKILQHLLQDFLKFIWPFGDVMNEIVKAYEKWIPLEKLKK